MVRPRLPQLFDIVAVLHSLISPTSKSETSELWLNCFRRTALKWSSLIEMAAPAVLLRSRATKSSS
jgi:hypothetical protein